MPSTQPGGIGETEHRLLAQSSPRSPPNRSLLRASRRRPGVSAPKAKNVSGKCWPASPGWRCCTIAVGRARVAPSSSIAVAPTGVFVIDAKKYQGKLEIVDKVVLRSD
jgi:hypothetical protein